MGLIFRAGTLAKQTWSHTSDPPTLLVAGALKSLLSLLMITGFSFG